MDIDPKVGGLVWVKRGNGSWWPGQIIDPESHECTEGFLDSPGPCRPIKLLGREDNMVEWYNLEKATRVKPFRCEEYATCIEKAQLAAVDPTRKRFYYPQRENGIIRALEVEKEMKKQNSNPDEISRLEEPNQVKISSSRPTRTHNDSDDEGVKRMKGLEDLGMSTKRKRIQKPHVAEFLKKKSNRRQRPLAEVLESAPEVLPPVETMPVCSSSLVVNKSDTIGVECYHVYSRRLVNGSDPNLSTQGRPIPTTERNCNEELYESVSTSSEVEEGGKSNWKLKGKRSFRNGNSDRVWSRSGYKSLKTSNPKPPPPLPRSPPPLPRSLPVRQSRFVMNPRYSSCFVTGELFEVNVHAKGSLTGGVPFTSLVSKSSNRSVTGHPITAEVLREGSTNDLVSGSCQKRQVMGPPKKHSKGHNCVVKAAATKVRKGGTTSAKKKYSLACVPVKAVFRRITVAVVDSTRRAMARPKRVVKPCRRYKDHVFW